MNIKSIIEDAIKQVSDQEQARRADDLRAAARRIEGYIEQAFNMDFASAGFEANHYESFAPDWAARYNVGYVAFEKIAGKMVRIELYYQFKDRITDDAELMLKVSYPLIEYGRAKASMTLRAPANPKELVATIARYLARQ